MVINPTPVETAKPAPVKEAAKGSVVTLSGTNLCVGCEMTTKNSAMGECERRGHRVALKVKDARDAEGKEIAGLKGKTLNYGANAAGKELTKEHVNQQVSLKGTLAKNGHRVDVSEIL